MPVPVPVSVSVPVIQQLGLDWNLTISESRLCEIIVTPFKVRVYAAVSDWFEPCTFRRKWKSAMHASLSRRRAPSRVVQVFNGY